MTELKLPDPFAASTGTKSWQGKGKIIKKCSPVDGKTLGEFNGATPEDYDLILSSAISAFEIWKNIPAPQRGEILRQYGLSLRNHKSYIGSVVSYEMGKSRTEGEGEVQEMIDIIDFAVGLSRQLYGLQMHSERPNHRLFEQWHPFGIVGIISAFNFPVAVWMWNAALSLVCGNVCIWKPSEKAPFSAILCQQLFAKVIKDNGLPEGISNLLIGYADIGNVIAKDRRVQLVSATGSTNMGRSVGETVAKRLGKSILELGGNNAIIVSQNADLEQAIPAIVFGAVGTARQRCTSTRRVIINRSIYHHFKEKIVEIYQKLSVGNPLDESNHLGPLIDQNAVKNYEAGIKKALKQGGKLLHGNKMLSGDEYQSGCYVEPTIIEGHVGMPILKEEIFAPILYIMPYEKLDDAIQIQNDVPQGLSSALFSTDMRETEKFLSVQGSDCGIANINIGTSGAEIGGAFGGEKDTGGGRESGSDAWKSYMRRQTCTINYGRDLHLAQGIRFDV